jgi:hypothetical protein
VRATGIFEPLRLLEDLVGHVLQLFAGQRRTPLMQAQSISLDERPSAEMAATVSSLLGPVKPPVTL